MRKIISMILVVVMTSFLAMSLVGCGDANGVKSPTSVSAKTQQGNGEKVVSNPQPKDSDSTRSQGVEEDLSESTTDEEMSNQRGKDISEGDVMEDSEEDGSKVKIWTEDTPYSRWNAYSESQIARSNEKAAAKRSENWYKGKYTQNKNLTPEEADILTELLDEIRQGYEDGNDGDGFPFREISLASFEFKKMPANSDSLARYSPITDKITLYALNDPGYFDDRDARAGVLHEIAHYQMREFIMDCQNDFWIEVGASLIVSRLTSGVEVGFEDYFRIYDAMLDSIESTGRDREQLEEKMLSYFATNNYAGIKKFVDKTFQARVFDKVKGQNLLTEAKVLYRALEKITTEEEPIYMYSLCQIIAAEEIKPENNQSINNATRDDESFDDESFESDQDDSANNRTAKSSGSKSVKTKKSKAQSGD